MGQDSIDEFISLVDNFISGYYNKHASKIFEFVSAGITEEPFLKSLEQKLSSVSDSKTYHNFVDSFTLTQIEQTWIEKIKKAYETDIAEPAKKLAESLENEIEKTTSSSLFNGFNENDKNKLNEKIRQQYARQTEHLESLFKRQYCIPELDFQLLKENKPFRALQFTNLHFLPVEEHFGAIANTVEESLDRIYPLQLAIDKNSIYIGKSVMKYAKMSKHPKEIKTENDLQNFLISLYPFFKKAVGFYKGLEAFKTNHSILSDSDFNSTLKLKELLKYDDNEKSLLKLFQLCLPIELTSHFDTECWSTLKHSNESENNRILEKNEVIFIKRDSVDTFNLDGTLIEQFSRKYKSKFLRILDIVNIDGGLKAKISDSELIYPSYFARLKINESTNYRSVAPTKLSEEQKIYSQLNLDGLMLFDKDTYKKFPIVPPVENKRKVLRIEVSDGCPHAGCIFCTEDRQYTFRIYSTDEIRIQKEKIYSYRNRADRIFLLGSDPLAMPQERFIQILNEINEPTEGFDFNLPKRCYGAISTISNLDNDYLKQLKDLGLSVIFAGLESGSENVLNYVHKNTLENQIYLAADKLRDADIDVSLMIMPGLGEKRFNEEHAEKTIKAVNYFAPKYLTVLTRNPTKPYENLINNDAENKFLDKKEIIYQIYEMFAGFNYFECKVTCADSKTTPLAANPVIMRPFNMKDKFKIMIEFTKALNNLKNDESVFLSSQTGDEDMITFMENQQKIAVDFYNKSIKTY